MKWNVGTKLAVGFGLALTIFTIVGVVSYQNTNELVVATEIRKHTYEVLLGIEDLTSLMKDVEIDQGNFILTGENRYADAFTSTRQKIGESINALRALTEDNIRQTPRFNRLESLVDTRLASIAATFEARRARGSEAAIVLIANGAGTLLSTDILQLMAEVKDEESGLLVVRSAAADAGMSTVRLTILWGTAMALGLAALAGFLITQNIAVPLRQLTSIADRIVVGDLSALPDADARTDEVGALSRAFGRMVGFLQSLSRGAEQIAAGDLRSAVTPQSDKDVLGQAFARMSGNLREQLGEMIASATVLGSAASQIVASTSQLAASASESATAVSETTTTVEEIRQTAQMANQKAKAVSETAQRTAQVSQTGRKATDSMIAAMDRIREQMNAISESMVRLSEQGHSIGQIIASVEDLSAQSNLLAVNAAIEAAKAGEQGKGFGVVAQEIKALSDQSRQATDQVRTILSDIQKATTAAVMASEQGTRAVEAGTTQTEAAGQSIQSLSASVTEAAQVAIQIAASSQQQLVGMDQVAAAMENIKQAMTQNTASTKQMEVAARNLDDLGRRLKKSGERYTL